MKKKLSEITRSEWIQYGWVDVTAMGDSGRQMVRLYPRTPEEAAKAIKDWDMTESVLDSGRRVS